MLQTDNVAKYIYKSLDKISLTENFTKRNIILYEFNAQSKVAVAYFRKMQIPPKISIVDSDIKNHGKHYNGIFIKSPEKVLKYATERDIVIVFDHGHEKKAEILRINRLMENQIYEISQFNYADFPCQFKIPSNAKVVELYEAHTKLVELLKYFHAFCSQYNLRYFFDGGSLIGAVRHQGFIPWDDDLDVTMPMPDYLKLCKLLSKECDKKYEFRCLHGDNQENLSLSTISRLLLRDVVTDCSHYPIHMMEGMGLDIWALAGFPDSVQEQEQYSLELEYLGDYWKENVVIPYNLSRDFKENYQNIQSKLLKAMTKYNYNDSNYVGYAYCGKILHVLNKKNRAFSKKIFAESIQLEFENEKYSCPKEYDSYLSLCFGDYMQLPPEEKRKSVNSGVIYQLS